MRAAVVAPSREKAFRAAGIAPEKDNLWPKELVKDELWPPGLGSYGDPHPHAVKPEEVKGPLDSAEPPVAAATALHLATIDPGLGPPSPEAAAPAEITKPKLPLGELGELAEHTSHAVKELGQVNMQRM